LFVIPELYKQLQVYYYFLHEINSQSFSTDITINTHAMEAAKK